MPGGIETGAHRGWRPIGHSLSGRLFRLTVLFVLASVALVFFPAVARYHHQLLDARVAAAELAILPFTEAPGAQLSAQLRMQLLARAGVRAIVLTGGGQHELFPVGENAPRIDAVYRAGDTGVVEQARDVIRSLAAPRDRIIRIDSATGLEQTPQIFVVANEEPIRAELIAFSLRALALAVFVAAITSILVFMTLYRLLVRPMQRLTDAMVAFRANPEDASRILEPTARQDEIGVAERELSTMQRDIYGYLQQKTRLALLGNAVTKIQHDLRNILSSAQLASDRLATSEDPTVKHVTPRLIEALDRAIALTSNTLRYGKAEEPPPQRQRLPLAPLVAKVATAALPEGAGVTLETCIPATLDVDADPDQLFRILLNLIKNAREALERLPEHARSTGKKLQLEADRVADTVIITVQDNGPGIPPKVRERLFLPFASAARPGGTGLGLAIARELARAHGGDVDLVESNAAGSRFRVTLPDRPGR
jgi:signal transduction histidine kinase